MVGFTSSKVFFRSALCIWITLACIAAARAAAPSAPTGVVATAGYGNATVSFTAPTNDGGKAITGYTATCGAQTATGSTSAIIVGSLISGTAVTCSVTATNGDGTSAASASSNSVTPLVLSAVLSRKIHGSAGPFDLTIDRTQALGGLVTVEPRAIGAGHTIAFRFNGTITSAGTASVTPAGTATAALVPSNSNEVLVALAGVNDNQRVTVTLTGVNGTVNAPPVSLGFLVGDVNNSRTVSASDIIAVKARTGATTISSNAIFDINSSGTINSSDVSSVKGRSGNLLESGIPVLLAITSGAPASAPADATYCHTFLASQVIPAGGWTINTGIAPAWATLNAKRGVLCGIPRSADIGTSTTFSVSATNSNGTTTQAVTLTVSAVVVPPPGITSGAPPVAVTDLTYCHAFSTSQIIPSGGWSISAGAPPQWATLNTKRGVICGIPRISDIGTSASFNVSATNANGTTTQAVTLTVTSVALPTPIITSVVPTSALVGATVTINGTGLTSVTSVKIGSADASFTSNGTGTAITTTVPALAVVGLGNVVLGTAISASAATSSFAVLAPGTGEFSIEGIPLPSISKFPTVTPSHAGLNGAGPYVNAYAMEPTRCITSPTLTRSWQHNIDLADYRNRTASDLFTLTGSEALTYKVTIPTGDTQGGVTYQENTAAGAGTAPAFISISTTPCDFDVAKIGYHAGSPTSQCYQSAGNGVTVPWGNFAGLPIAYCTLTKGQTYYVNIRFVDGVTPVSSCPGTCGGGLTFN